MKHTLKLRALTEEYDEDYESRNDDFERYARHFLKTNVCRLTKDVWTIKTDCSYDEIYEFLEDYGWGFFEFISLDDFTNSIQLYDYIWEQRRNAEAYDNMPKSTRKMKKSIPSIHEIFADHLLASHLENASVQKSKTAPMFSDMVKSVREGEHLEKDAHDFKVGDILVSSWGYDQTNVQWYQVVGVTPKSVKIREIQGKVQETGFMSGESVPIPDAFIDNLWFGEQKIARVNPHGWVNITSDGYLTAQKWDGYPERVSWYA